VSYSWVDPHFATLYARREETRMNDRLAADLREREAREAWVPPAPVRPLSWIEQDSEIRRRIRVI